MNMKNAANAMKFVIAVEMVVLFQLGHAPMDIIMISAAQYALFFPVDASIFVKNLKGA